ncbi:MAG: hypothetical protein WAN36_02345 [Calditrichia bacterium]
MGKTVNYQEQQLQAIQNFYKNIARENQKDLPIREAIVRWFTEGYAETFRMNYLQQRSIPLQG